MVACELPKLDARVRFPPPALNCKSTIYRENGDFFIAKLLHTALLEIALKNFSTPGGLDLSAGERAANVSPCICPPLAGLCIGGAFSFEPPAFCLPPWWALGGVLVPLPSPASPPRLRDSNPSWRASLGSIKKWMSWQLFFCKFKVYRTFIKPLHRHMSHNSDCHKYTLLQLFTKAYLLIIGYLHKGGSKSKKPQLRELAFS